MPLVTPRSCGRSAQATAEEVRATGIPWTFGPCVCVARDERWGRTYESFGEDPALVSSMETIIDGLQGRGRAPISPDHVLATAKHYAGDGDTEYDAAAAADNVGKPWYEQRYTIDQGITVTSRDDFETIDLAPYATAIRRHGVRSVMPSFSSVDWIEDGVGDPIKMHAHQELITDVLKGDFKFGGFVISDWEGIHQIPDPDNPGVGGLTPYKVRVGVNAGTDMFMEPFSAQQFEELLLAEVDADRVSMERIDDAVSRILEAKFELGLFEHPLADEGQHRPGRQPGASCDRAAGRGRVTGAAEERRRRACRWRPTRTSTWPAATQTTSATRPAAGRSPGRASPATSSRAPPSSRASRRWHRRPTVTYSADASAPMTGADVGVVVVGETPYAEGYGDVGGPECGFCSPEQLEEKSLSLLPADKAVIDTVCDAIETCVVIVVSGRPQVLTDQLDKMDALVASWLPGSEGAGVADVLFGSQPFTGTLPMTWPRTEAQVPINVGDADYDPLFAFGWGLSTD